MSPSKFNVNVRSADRLAELSIVDSHYTTQALGVGQLACKLPRGLYVARARSGEKTQQQKVRVSDRDVTVEFSDRGDVRSSAPVDNSFEQSRLQIINNAPQVTPNANAWMVLALRQAVGSDPTLAFAPVNSASGFELFSLSGTPITSFASQALTPAPSGHWATALRVASGWYTLAIPGDLGSKVLLPLYTGDRFSPSVFIELRADRSEGPRPDLDRLLVSYDDREVEIFRYDDRMRATELARRSLVLGRNLLTPALMEIFFQRKYQDPMLGLFAAYLLLSDSNGKQYFSEVVENTGSILQYPQYPDLVIARALGRKLGWWTKPPLPGDSEPLVAPPLLRASWEGMVSLKQRREEVVASELLRSVASSLIRSNAWVLWRQKAVTSTVTRSARGLRRKSAGTGDALLSGLVERLRTDPDLAKNFRQEVASEAYEGGMLSRTIARTALHLTAESERIEIPHGYTKRLAEALSVPLPLVVDEIDTISEVLGQKLSAKGRS